MNADVYHESRHRLAGMNGSTGVGCLIIFEGRRRAAICGRRPLLPVLAVMREGSVRDCELVTGSLTSVRLSRAASSLVRFFTEERYGFGSALEADDNDDDGGGGGSTGGDPYRGCKRSYIIEGGATRTFDARSDSLWVGTANLE